MEQNQIPLYEAINKFIKRDPISFHVPGHKNGLLLEGTDKYHESLSILKYDLTELTGLDNLHSPEDIILQSHQLLTDYYQTLKSYFLVNGSTVGNLVMVLATFNEGDIVFVQRNCHKSILNALMLAKLNPVFLSPEIDNVMKVPAGIDLSVIEDAYNLYPEAKGLIITYPNYYGIANDIGDIIKMVHEHNGIVLVDEAHGPHFRIGSPFPPSALQMGADIVVHSAHKMLPAMTMGSFFHINSDRISVEQVEFYLSTLQSSSPSYPIMMSLDIARHYLAQFTDEDIRYTLYHRNKFITGLEQIKDVSVIHSIDMDPLKVIMRHNHYSGFELQKVLEDQNLFVEMSDPYQVVLILPLLKEKTIYPFERALVKIRMALDKSFSELPRKIKLNINRNSSKVSQLDLDYYEMKKKKYEWVKLVQSVGRISAKMVVPYPPGIPHLLPGERITDEKVEELEQLLLLEAKFQGYEQQLKQGKIAVFME